MNSRQKGKRGEREAAVFLTVNGLPARRGQQFSGSPDSPDVVCPLLPGVHLEVKRCERTNLEAWLERLHIIREAEPLRLADGLPPAFRPALERAR